jgi:SAM-dependent methyltransferase
MHQKSLCPKLEELVGSVKNILDVGCSTGGTTVALALSRVLNASEVVGVDPNQLSLRAAEIRSQAYDLPADRIRFSPTTPDEALPFHDDQFDLVVCVSVLEYIGTLGAREQLASELQRVVRPGGHIFLATPNPIRLREYHTRRWFGNQIRRDGYPWASTGSTIRQMFDGCTPIRMEGHLVRLAKTRMGPATSLLPSKVVSTLITWFAPWQKILLRRSI